MHIHTYLQYIRAYYYLLTLQFKREVQATKLKTSSSYWNKNKTKQKNNLFLHLQQTKKNDNIKEIKHTTLEKLIDDKW